MFFFAFLTSHLSSQNCIVGMADLLHDTPMNQFQEDVVRMITRSGELLSSVVDDVIDFSKIQAGDVQLDIKMVDIQTVLDSVTSSIQMKADQAETGLWIRPFIGTSIPQYYETDAKRLQQILFNLLGNAVKFSKKNAYIDFTVNIVNKGDNKYINFHIKDYGKGIQKESMRKIFEPFHQESKETSTVYGGTGLGLPVALELVRSMGGDISVDSVVGEWTEFTVELPFNGKEVTEFSDHVALMENTGVLMVVARPSTDCSVVPCLRNSGICIEMIPSCKDLEKTALAFEAKQSIQNYIVLVHDEALDEIMLANFQAQRKSQLITFGYNPVKMAAAHITSPCRVFPSLLLPIMTALVERIKTGKHNIIETTLDSSIIIINGQEPGPTNCHKYSDHLIGNDNDSLFSDLRILIAEDNIVNQKVLIKTLNRLGMESIDVVDNGEKAVQAAAEKQYDLIFMVRCLQSIAWKDSRRCTNSIPY